MNLGQLLTSLRSGPGLGLQHSVPQAFATHPLPPLSRPLQFAAPQRQSLGGLLAAPGDAASSGSLSTLVPANAWGSGWNGAGGPGGDIGGFGSGTIGGESDEGSNAPPGSGVPSSIATASAISNAVNSPIGMALAAIAPMGIPIALGLNEGAENALDAGLAAQAQAEANIGLDVFGGEGPSVGPGPGPASATDSSSVSAVNGADAQSDAAAAAAAAADGDGGGGGGGGGGGKIICTALYNMGHIQKDFFEADQRYGKELYQKNRQTYRGYRVWAEWVVLALRGEKTYISRLFFWKTRDEQRRISAKIASCLVRWPTKQFVDAVAYNMGVTKKRNYIGSAIHAGWLGVCTVVGFFVKKK